MAHNKEAAVWIATQTLVIGFLILFFWCRG